MKSYEYQTVQKKHKQPLNIKNVRILERYLVPASSNPDILICFLVLQYSTFFNPEELRGTLTSLLLILKYLTYLNFIFLDFSKYFHLKNKHLKYRFFEIIHFSVINTVRQFKIFLPQQTNDKLDAPSPYHTFALFDALNLYKMLYLSFKFPQYLIFPVTTSVIRCTVYLFSQVFKKKRYLVAAITSKITFESSNRKNCMRFFISEHKKSS